MKDFRVVSARVSLTVHSVSPIRGFLPPSIVVLGDKLDKAQEIFFNGVAVKDFVVAAPSRLVVRIPETQIGKALREFQVFSSVQISKLNAQLSLSLSRPSTVSGMDRLIQAWMIVFMTTPGSDVFDPTSGGGGRAIIGRPTDREHKNVAADLVLAIERTKSELLRKQAQNQRLPLSERLLTSDLESLSFDDATSTLAARVSLKNVIGNQADVDLR